MRYGQYKDLREGYASSSNFKTVGTYILQPVTISVNTRQLLDIYFLKLRPQVSQEHMPHATDYLFLTFQGTPHKALGRMVTRVFEGKGQGHLTSTTLRSLVETEAKCLRDEGIISTSSVTALQNISGHSEKTASMYYIKRRAQTDVVKACKMFRKFKKPDPVIDTDDIPDTISAGDSSHHDGGIIISENETEEDFSFSSMMQRDISPSTVWGTNHPDFNMQGERQRARWSEEELRYLAELTARLLNHPQDK